MGGGSPAWSTNRPLLQGFLWEFLFRYHWSRSREKDLIHHRSKNMGAEMLMKEIRLIASHSSINHVFGICNQFMNGEILYDGVSDKIQNQAPSEGLDWVPDRLLWFSPALKSQSSSVVPFHLILSFHLFPGVNPRYFRSPGRLPSWWEIER